MWVALEAISDTLSAARPGYVALALDLYVFSLVVAGARWRAVLSGLGCPVGLKPAVQANMAGIFVNNVTPASRLGGEACRIALITRLQAVALPRATLSVMGDRLMDVPPVAVLALSTLPALRTLRIPAWMTIVAATVVLPLGVVALARLSRTRIADGLATWRTEWRSVPACRRAIPRALAHSSILWALDVARIMAVAAACSVALTIPQAATLSVAALLGGLAPTIGGLGVIEAGLFGGLIGFGVRTDAAIAVVAIERSITYGIGTGAGGMVTAVLGGRWLWAASRSHS